jgi:hypothetical protein
VVARLQSEHITTDHAFKLLQNSFPQGFPEMIIIPITESKMVWTIISTNNKNLSSFDEISNYFLVLNLLLISI